MKSEQHPYCYPGTDVLRNKLNIRDRSDLNRFERLEARNRAETLAQNLPVSVDSFRAIHRYLFGNLYDWAGEYRTVETGRTGPFCKPEYIAIEMDRRFALIGAENGLIGLSHGTFATRAAEHVNELNAVHPFLDGNGRTIRAFLHILAVGAGYEIDLTQIAPDTWNVASKLGFHQQNHEPMRSILTSAVKLRDAAGNAVLESQADASSKKER